MKNLNGIVLIGLGLTVIIASCAAPKLTNNDRGKYKYEKIDPKDVLTVNVSVLPLPVPSEKEPEKPKTFFDLRDSIPNTLLRVIGKDPSKFQLFIDAIKSPLSNVVAPAKPAPSKEIDNNVIKVRFNFSAIQRFFNDPRLLHPNTKLEYLNTTLTLDPTQAFIHTIDRLENEFEQIDMGTLERNQEVKFSTTLTGEAGNEIGSDNTTTSSGDETDTSTKDRSIDLFDEKGNKIGTTKKGFNNTTVTKNSSTDKTTASQKVGGKAELQFANNETMKEALALKFKKIKTSFSFSQTDLTVSQRGRPMIGISDNVFVTATLKVPNSALKLDTKDVIKFEDLADASGKLQSIDKIKRTPLSVHYAPCHSASDISIKVSYEGAIRATDNLKRGRNVLEFDDKVTYYRFEGNNAGSSIKIKKSDFCRNVFRITAKTSDGKSYILNTGSGTLKEVLLYSDHDPAAFLEWLEFVIISGDNTLLQSNKGDMVFIDRTDATNRIVVSKSSLTATDMNNLKSITEISAEIKTQ